MSTSPPRATQGGAGRDADIDGLRGVAAMLVVVFHLHLPIAHLVDPWIPSGALALIAGLGATGVRVFFVLSGLVIAMTLWRTPLGGADLGRFALRRSLRLDPPYWATIVLVILLDRIRFVLFPETGGPQDLSPTRLLAHLFYLQDLLGVEPLSAVFWTLCMEVQFYLALALWLVACRRAGLDRGPGVLAGVLALDALSVAMAMDLVPTGPDGLFVRHWHAFSLGVLLAAVRCRGASPAWLVAACLLELLPVMQQPGAPAHWAGLAALALLLTGARRPALTAWLRGRVWQFLGRQSYSLYLVHPTVGWSAMSLGLRLLPLHAGPQAAVGVFLLGVLVSVAAAELMRRAVEAPAIDWARRWTRRPGSLD